ncbi:MAG: hypothetical protein ABW203_04675 [Novosphingobium sp.]
MAEQDGFRDKVDNVLRDSATNQANAYQSYSALLSRLAGRQIKSAEFAREAIDIYLDAAGKVAAAGALIVGETVTAGLKGAGVAFRAAEKQVAEAEDKIAPKTAAAKPKTTRAAASRNA